MVPQLVKCGLVADPQYCGITDFRSPNIRKSANRNYPQICNKSAIPQQIRNSQYAGETKVACQNSVQKVFEKFRKFRTEQIKPETEIY